MKRLLVPLLAMIPTIAIAQYGDEFRYGPKPFYQTPAGIVCIVIASVVVIVFITRLIFSIPHIARSLRAQTRLLELIALEKGCDPHLVSKIIDYSENQITQADLPSSPRKYNQKTPQ